MMGIGRVLALRFQSGAIVLFIRWRDGAARDYGRWIYFWGIGRGRRARR
jgi:hypothetical protein